MDIRIYAHYQEGQILALYESVGWTNYTVHPEMLRRAFAGSHLVLGAYESDRLVGVVRVVGDGASICYVQDLLVHPSYQRKKIGTALLCAALSRESVYQTVLMTDDSPGVAAFYKSCGLTEARTFGCCTFIRIRSGTEMN